VDARHHLGTPTGDRVIFSNENFPCMPSVIFNDGTLYDRLPSGHLVVCATCFPIFDVTIAMGLRDPATLVARGLPQAARRCRRSATGSDQIDLRLAECGHRVITDCARPCPSRRFCCGATPRDTPLVWPEIVQALTGAHPIGMTLEAQDTLLSTIMSETGLQRMRAYLRKQPPKIGRASAAGLWAAFLRTKFAS